jgi:glycosyltransferase involved in cell wall biosynthesis
MPGDGARSGRAPAARTRTCPAGALVVVAAFGAAVCAGVEGGAGVCGSVGLVPWSMRGRGVRRGPSAPCRGAAWGRPVLQLRGGQDSAAWAERPGARSAPAAGDHDGREAETREQPMAFTRSPSPLPANPALEYPFSRSPSRSPSADPSGFYTRSSSPHGLLIAMCAWESLHTIAVGGVAPHVTELAAGLARRGNEVHLFVRAGPDMSQPSYQCIDDVHVHRVPIELNPDFVTECNNMCNAQVWYIREAERYMQTNFDVVHAHDWLCGKAIVQMKQAGRNTVFTCHSTEVGRVGRPELDHVSQRIQAIEAEACDVADRVIAVSSKFADEVKEQYFSKARGGRCDRSKLRMVYNGIHPEVFQDPVNVAEVRARHGIGEDTPFILSVGRLIPQKGPDILVGALPKLLESHPDAVVVFVGEGEMRDYLEGQAYQLGVAHAVRFLGTIWGQPLKDLFKACTLVCVPSRYEPFGITVLEAWACEKPVVVTHQGGPGEFVAHGKDGYKVNDEASNIAWGLREILCNPRKAANLGKRGRSRCAEFSYAAPPPQLSSPLRSLTQPLHLCVYAPCRAPRKALAVPIQLLYSCLDLS